MGLDDALKRLENAERIIANRLWQEDPKLYYQAKEEMETCKA